MQDQRADQLFRSVERDIERRDRLSEKFDFFFLGLAFAVLGLSIQTASFGESKIADSAQLLGWASLLSSGLVGLKRMEELPNFYSMRVGLEAAAAAIALRGIEQIGKGEALNIGEGEEIGKRIRDSRDAIAKRTWARFVRQKWLFLAGMVLEATATALPHVVETFGYTLR
jgi:hypothetical protein